MRIKKWNLELPLAQLYFQLNGTASPSYFIGTGTMRVLTVADLKLNEMYPEKWAQTKI